MELDFFHFKSTRNVVTTLWKENMLQYFHLQQNTGKKATLFTSSLKAIKPVKYDLFKDILLPSDSKLLAACQGKQ